MAAVEVVSRVKRAVVEEEEEIREIGEEIEGRGEMEEEGGGGEANVKEDDAILPVSQAASELCVCIYVHFGEGY